MPASPPAARHGTWRLANAGDTDKRIREMLDRGRDVEEIANQLGIAVGYVEAFIRDEMKEELGPPVDDKEIERLIRDGVSHRDIASRLKTSCAEVSRVRKGLGLQGRPGPMPAAAAKVASIVRGAEPAASSTRVLCIVAGAEIGARDCIARQCEQKCFCPKASFSITAMAQLVLPGTRLEDQLAACKAVARSVLTKPNLEDRFLGPALQAFRGELVDQPLIAGDLPAPPSGSSFSTKKEEPPPVVAAPAAPMSAPRADHADPSKSSPPPAPPAKEKPMPRTPPAPPAKEKPMPRPSKLEKYSDDELRTMRDRLGSITAVRAEIGCGMKLLQERFAKFNAGPTAPAAALAAGADKAAAGLSTVMKNDPVAELLEEQRKHCELRIADHQAQIARIDKALAALRE